MSLVRLLTSGKSLIGLQNSTSRYRMGSGGLLPKFGSDKNPFSSSPDIVPIPRSTNTSSPVARYQMTPAELAAARLKETKRLPVSTVAPAAPAPAEGRAGALLQLRLRIVEFIQKWKSVSWWPVRKKAGAAPAPVAAKTHIQTELSLDNVKVIRNDLNDADVEIVPAKPAPKSKPQPMAPAHVEETGELIKT